MMRKLIFLLLVLLVGCKKEVTPRTSTVKTHSYILSFGVEPEKNATYVIQKLKGTEWVDILTVPDTSATGDYKVELSMESKEQVRVKGIDETVTFSAAVGAE